MKTTLRHSIFLSLLILAVSGSSPARTDLPDAHLSGTLQDASGGRVGNVQVTAQLNGAVGAPLWKTTSATDGSYALALPPGRYHLQFVRPSFASREFVLDFAAGETRTLDLRLELERVAENVVVTANAQPLEIDRTPAPVDLISRQEIEQRQAVSLSDLLATQPGASIARTGRFGGLATFFLDGGNSNFTKVLVDGTPVNEPGGAFNFSNFALDNVDKVEIVHGAESALYGSDAMSGVIQVFTHRGTTRRPAFDLFAEGGKFSSARGGAQVSGLLGAFDYSAAASYFQTDGQGPNDGFLNRTFSGNFGWRFSESNQLRLMVRSNSSFAGIPGPTLLAPPSLTQFDALHRFSANLAWNFHTGAHWEHRLSGTESRTLDTNADPASYGSYIDQFNRAGFQEQSIYSFGQGAAAAGYEYQVENGYPGDLYGLHARRNNQAGFLDARWLPISRITLSAGARAEANTNFGTRVVPRAGVVFAVRYGKGFWGDTRARIAYGQGIKEPALDESFGNDPCFPGNSSLRPVRSRTFNFGFDQFLDADRIQVSASYFTNRFRDIVSFAYGLPTNACQFGTGTFFNTDLARARGVNFTAKARPLRWLTIEGSYSYDDTRVLEAPNASFSAQQPGNHLLRRPVHSGNVVLNASFYRINLNLAGYFSGVREDVNFLAPAVQQNPGYARFDVTSRYELGRGLSVYARATNLFDKHYQDSIGYPALGRDFRLGMNYRFGGKDR
jgi:outer membrane cobalamin receptor